MNSFVILMVDHPARRSACRAFETCEAYHTAEMVSAVEAILTPDTEVYWKKAIHSALRDARRTVKRNAK
jgi:hypothetical protein